MAIPWKGVCRRLWLGALLGLTGCASLSGIPPFGAVGPDYAPPPAAGVVGAERWQAALPHDGKPDSMIDWWRRFDDPLLPELLARAEADSPSLAEAVARIDEARSGLTAAHSAFGPAGSVNAHGMRNNGSADVPMAAQSTRGVGIDAQWEIDLFGRVRRGAESAAAHVESAEHGWHAARISLAAEVAGKYVDYRACQLTLRSVQADVRSRLDTARIAGLSAEAGMTAPADVQLARAGAAEMSGFQSGQAAACAVARKALVALTGMREDELLSKLDGNVDRPGLPTPQAFGVDSLPVALLAQRPDLAAAERELAAASADIGIAAANRYPRLALIGTLTRDKTELAGGGPTVLSKPWSFGPTLSLPLFQAGALAAQQSAAEARYAQALARYRGAVRAAVQEVETLLIGLDSARKRVEQADLARQGYQAYLLATEKNWRAGGISLLNLEDARRLATAAERNEIAVQRDRVLHWIALYKALGGGWKTGIASASTPSSPSTANPSIPSDAAPTAATVETSDAAVTAATETAAMPIESPLASSIATNSAGEAP